MTDAEWAVARPLLPVPGWLRGRGGQPEAYCHRQMLDAIRYPSRVGEQFALFAGGRSGHHRAYLQQGLQLLVGQWPAGGAAWKG
ncbi:transposase [Streptomyces sp. NPDC086549]|uniref:transposase n=1 Tax=Streptomyces sp. NPDC086549 TaxID=3365752 RepID=UPI00380CD9CD